MHAFEGQLLSLLVGRPSRERVDPLRLSTRRETGLKMLHATWSWDKGSASTSVLHYCPYPDEISKKIEECYVRMGPNHFECDVGGGRVVTKTHKGLVQHVKSQPRTGHTREPDPKHNALKHTTTRNTATHERNTDAPHVDTHTHTHTSRHTPSATPTRERTRQGNHRLRDLHRLLRQRLRPLPPLAALPHLHRLP